MTAPARLVPGIINGPPTALAGPIAVGGPFLPRGDIALQETLHGPAGDPPATADDEHRKGEITPIDGPVDGRPALAEQDRRLLHAQQGLSGKPLVTSRHGHPPVDR